MSWQIVVLFAACLGAMAGFLHVVPTLTRPEIFFAVQVAPEFRRTSEGRAILRRYRLTVWISTAAAILLAVAIGLPVVALAVEAAGILGAMVRGHGQALHHAAAPSPVVEVELSAPSERLPGGPIVVLLPALLLTGLGLWATFNPDNLPTRFPVHWGFEGPDQWITTTTRTVWGFLGTMASVILLLAGGAWVVLNWSRRIATSGVAAAAERRFRRRMALMMVVFEYLCTAPAWFALLAPQVSAAMTVWGVVLVLVIVGFAISLIRIGQGGSLVAARAGAPPTGDRTPDSAWKWGLVYVNSADPAILVEKRLGIGYTLNLGNHWTWVIIALLLAPVAIGLSLGVR